MKNYVKHIRKTLDMLIHDLSEHIDECCYDSKRNFSSSDLAGSLAQMR